MQLPENAHLLDNLEEQRDHLRILYGSSTIEIRRSVLSESPNLLHIFETGNGSVERIAMGRFVEVPFSVTVGYGLHKEKIIKRVVKFIPEKFEEKKDEPCPEEPPRKGFFWHLFNRGIK